ncbi:hypothetical protein [Halogeometricum limi]|uniref:Uncharacterized protein n=1 Tax=Halogeometricum limi TaxID=555875 RepID=A0A1I6GJZ6_9EURY|nr:hypothetical protein [Halogeometricum limi]SFR42525.1 hypothetical protein SAMN04488124_1162 [Halogeometricum limi]
MPGTPDPVLGSSLLTHVVAGLVAGGAVLLALHYRSRTTPRRLALAGGTAYAVAAILLWGVVRVATNEFAQLAIPSLPTFAAVVLASGLVVFAHTALALYFHARFGYLTPLVVLFGATAFLVWVFLHVRGESDPIGLYWLLFGPAILTALLVLAGVEYGVRLLL